MSSQQTYHVVTVKTILRFMYLIGEGNVIREYVTIHRGTKEGTDTVIGNGCFLMVGAHVAHNCRLADGVVW